MILDKKNQFGMAQAVTTAAASTDYIDQGAAGDRGAVPLYLVIQTRVAATSTASATVDFQLQCDDNSAFSSAKTLFSSGAIAKTVLTINSEPVKVQVPLGAERYLRVYYGVATADLTAGTFDAFLTPSVNNS